MTETDERTKRLQEIMELDFATGMIVTVLELFVSINAKALLRWYAKTSLSTKILCMKAAVILNPFSTCLVFYSEVLYPDYRILSYVMCASGCALSVVSTVLLGRTFPVPETIGVILKAVGVILMVPFLSRAFNFARNDNPILFYCGIMAYSMGLSVLLINYCQGGPRDVSSD